MHTGAPEHFCRPGLISQSSSCAELLQTGRQRVRTEFFIHVARQQKGFAELGGHRGHRWGSSGCCDGVALKINCKRGRKSGGSRAALPWMTSCWLVRNRCLYVSRSTITRFIHLIFVCVEEKQNAVPLTCSRTMCFFSLYLASLNTFCSTCNH